MYTINYHVSVPFRGHVVVIKMKIINVEVPEFPSPFGVM